MLLRDRSFIKLQVVVFLTSSRSKCCRIWRLFFFTIKLWGWSKKYINYIMIALRCIWVSFCRYSNILRWVLCSFWRSTKRTVSNLTNGSGTAIIYGWPYCITPLYYQIIISRKPLDATRASAQFNGTPEIAGLSLLYHKQAFEPNLSFSENVEI